MKIGVEALVEPVIEEIKFDGTEIFKQPTTRSEQLTAAASNFDFHKYNEDQPDKPTPDKKSTSSDNWKDTKDCLYKAFTEISVLSDVLAISKMQKAENETPYLDFSHIAPSNELNKSDFCQNRAVIMHKLQKSLKEASITLQRGAADIVKSHNARNNARLPLDYHDELLRIRQHWKLRKITATKAGKSASILGDLGLRSSSFQVIKKVENLTTSAEHLSDTIDVRLTSQSKLPSYLRFTTEKEQKPFSSSAARLTCSGIPIEVLSHVPETKSEAKNAKEKKSTESENFSFSKKDNMYILPKWQMELCKAQNLLWQEAILSNLNSRKFLPLELSNPVQMNSREVVLPITRKQVLKMSLENNIPEIGYDPNYAIRYYVGKLVIKHLEKLSKIEKIEPSTAILGISNDNREAAVTARDLNSIQHDTDKANESILTKVISFSKLILNLRVIENAINQITFNDPYMVAHWPSICSANFAEVKIFYTSAGHTQLHKSGMHLKVTDKGITAVHREGLIEELEVSIDSVIRLIKRYATGHQLHACQLVSKALGWQYSVSGSVSDLNIDPSYPHPENVGCVNISSPKFQPTITVIARWPHPKIYVTKPDFKNSEIKKMWSTAPNIELPTFEDLDMKDEVLSKIKWSSVSNNMIEISLAKVPGLTFLHKIESIIMCLS